MKIMIKNKYKKILNLNQSKENELNSKYFQIKADSRNISIYNNFNSINDNRENLNI